MTMEDGFFARPAPSRYRFARQNGAWRHAEGPTSAGTSLALTDEGDFMRFILNEGIPLQIDGVLFHPLCCEFPASPGVDMVWASDGGQLALGELKRAYRGHDKVCPELAHHYKDDSVELRLWSPRAAPSSRVGEAAELVRLAGSYRGGLANARTKSTRTERTAADTLAFSRRTSTRSGGDPCPRFAC